MHATQQGVRRLTNLTTGGPVHVDVEDGRIRRIMPLQLDESDARKTLRLIDALEGSDDVQEVYANFDISDEVLEAVAG